jgi:Uma2 family endonuclease
MATAPGLLTPEDFHRLYDGRKPYYEYWFGEAIQKLMRVHVHAIVCTVLLLFLERLGSNAMPEVRLKVIREAEPVPDIIAIRGRAAGAYPKVAPELCIEVLSPDDRFNRVLRKAIAYIEWGTAHAWIIDPAKRTAWHLDQNNSPNPEFIGLDGILAAGPDTAITMAELFAEVDKRWQPE